MALRTGEELPATCSEGSWSSTLSPLGEATVGSTQGWLVGILGWVSDTIPGTRGSVLLFPLVVALWERAR